MNRIFFLAFSLTLCSGVYAQTQLFIRGTAVPGGSQQLERFSKYPSGYCFKFHGTLNPGTLYISTTEEHKSTSAYYKSKYVDSNIVCTDMDATRTRDTTDAAWVVLFQADNYRFTFNPVTTTTATLTGELFTRWYEAWICGGCVQDNQTPGQGNWQLSAGKQMTQDINDPNVFTWVGELKNYTSNQEPKRFKINGQYGWSPKVLHPFKQDENILTASQVWYNGSQDFKWSIAKDGYYSIRINVFLETIEAEYLGTEKPTGIEESPELDCSLDVDGLTIGISSPLSVSASLYGVDGAQVANASGNGISVSAPSHGLYILYVTDGVNGIMRKIRL